jgi:glycine cleavage system transcriptional repressor
MRQMVSITAMGKDKPGIVAEFSRVLFETGCNIEESSMVLLRGEFAMLLLVSLPKLHTFDSFSIAVRAAAREMDLTTSIRQLSEPEMAASAVNEDRLYVISVYGSDRPGIVYNITRILAERKVNITDLNTRLIHGGSSPVYVMLMEVEVPESVEIAEIENEIAEIKSKLKVDVTINPAEGTEF